MKMTWIVSLLLFAVCTLSRADINTIRITSDTPWVVAPGEAEPVRRALADVQKDWYKVLGHRPLVLEAPPEKWQGPVVYLGRKGAWLKDLQKEPIPGPEGHVLRVQRDAAGRPAILATGSDIRGTVYAVYALSEEILGVDPWYFWTDQEPRLRKTIELPSDLNRTFGPATFRYRGWFINDEDLLGVFAPDPLRENPFSMTMLDRICETILRLRGNMIVPGTFNFPDEKCWELASRRGLALNMHHILVVGLNTYRWPKDVPFSYVRHPDIMERYWRECIAAFKGREVVWTVGYRGQHDRPFWADEPNLKSPEARGAVISKAIARQVELIREVDPKGMIIANLWMEGADMMRAGHLTLPEGVVQVWPDDGSGIIRDQGTVQAGQGIYYHTAMMNGMANQLSEAVNPGRIYQELGRFNRAGATSFFLTNVSDVRAVPLSTDCAMRFAWNARPYQGKSDAENMTEFIADWSRRQYPEVIADDIAAVYARYFDIPYARDDQRLGEHRMHTMLRNASRKAVGLVAEGKPLTPLFLDRVQRFKTFVDGSRDYVTKLAMDAESVAPWVRPDRRSFYQAHALTPLQIHRYSLEMLDHHCQAMLAYTNNDKAQAIAHEEKALQANEAVFGALRRAETGKWSAWYMGDRFTNVLESREQLRLMLAAFRGDPLPLVRPRVGYPELYKYQERFSENFPLLYGRPPAAE